MTARHRRRRSGGEEGSVILVLLLIMVISIVVVTVTTGSINQLNIGSTDTARNDTLQGALAGEQAALTDIRAASSGGDVVPSELPCGTVTGVTNGTGTTSYSATVQYYEENVVGSYVKISCASGSGPTVTSSSDFLARAVVTACSPSNTCPSASISATTANWRRVVSTYNFQTTDVNIPGGPIYNYLDQDCLVAVFNDGTDAQQGISLDSTNTCAPGNSMARMEQFQYTTSWNLEIQIGEYDYCIQDGEDLATPTSSPVALVSCTGTSTSPALQWGVNDSGELQGVVTGGSGNPNSWCIDDQLAGQTIPTGTTDVDPTILSTTTCSDGTDSSVHVSASAGAGGAAPTGSNTIGPTDQLVNYQEFGYCMDVTNQNVGWSYLIDYDCKQYPDTASYPVWNQRWCFLQKSTDTNGNAVGLLYTPYGQTTCTGVTNPYCLTSPQTTGSASTTAWVTVSSCSLSTAPATDELWTTWGSNGGAAHDYTWSDYWGDCLETSPSDAQNPGYGQYWSVMQVDACAGSYAQKWNAPATIGASQVSNLHEGTGSGAVTGP